MLTAGTTKAWGYVRGERVELELRSIGGGMYLRSDAAEAFRKMRSAAAADGYSITVNSAFRTEAQQEALVVSRSEWAAPAGFSPHQAGIAVDIESGSGDGTKEPDNEGWLWMTSSAASFDWVNVGLKFSEPWHWEYKKDFTRGQA